MSRRRGDSSLLAGCSVVVDTGAVSARVSLCAKLKGLPRGGCAVVIAIMSVVVNTALTMAPTTYVLGLMTRSEVPVMAME